MARTGDFERISGLVHARAAGDERRDSERDEVRALARLALDELARGVSGIGDIHGAIANRVFTHVGAQGAIARAAHGAISGRVYAGIGGGTAALGRFAGRRLQRGPQPRTDRSHRPRWVAEYWE